MAEKLMKKGGERTGGRRGMEMMPWEFRTHYTREIVKLEPLNLTYTICRAGIEKRQAKC
jgi:hypothetical protein